MAVEREDHKTFETTHVRRKVCLFAICNTDQTWVLSLNARICIVHSRVFTIMSHYDGDDERLKG